MKTILMTLLLLALTATSLAQQAPPAVPAAAPPAPASDDTAARLKALEEKILALETEVKTLKEAQALPAAPSTAAASSSSETALTTNAYPQPAPAQVQGPTQGGVIGGATAHSKALNPDIGIIGNFVGVAGRNAVNSLPALSLQESELSLQAVVDPYARADFFLAFGEQGVEVEEGYITFTSVPGGFVPRIGKMRAAFGRVNAFHNHTLPWVDRPLVTFNLLGGSLQEADIGIKDAGVSVSRILPFSKRLFVEATGEVFRGDSGSLFQASQRSDVAVVGHLKTYRDLTESSNLEIGTSYARGHNDVGTNFLTQLFGADATFRWRPLRRAIYHSFTARGEFMWSERQQLPTPQRAFGFYTSADYRLNRRWTVGGRYDRSARARAAESTDSGFSAVLTYWPSEFSQIRGQFRRTAYAEGHTANELLVQFLFTVGAHGAHPF